MYDEDLLGGDASHWAFGTSFEDPLAGVDTTIPDGVDADELAAYCLMLGDDALVYSHRLSEWCSHAPDLEEDIALANIALDLLGQARLLLARAAAASSVGRPGPAGGFAGAARGRAGLLPLRPRVPQHAAGRAGQRRLRRDHRAAAAVLDLAARAAGAPASSRDQVLSAIAAKGVKEVTYHRDYAGRWFLTLAKGTDESRSRLLAALPQVFAFHDELFTDHSVETSVAAAGVGVAPSSVAAEVGVILEQVFSVSGVERHDVPQIGPVAGGMGRDGRHTEALSHLLAEMQSVARAHPLGVW